ncbi:glycosyltransferase family 4 protein [Prosthecochloris sp. SCSIO W1101]|uniref:glycosyltransferase family 4 protein n=1 Tax=Prosthecochloris sp. SCSIO W1101 TaxID=2992242 RepID=UPI00223DC762|nr:glycosyltransferase family 4 protein [Prosthecochloris sp. SCSIO W1101]UZJ41337.1 glycosyltransferase family 4 protein [Prosthecochloris sp. SCSIO W1101]
MNQTPIGYLCSEYPAISHTFIYREIESIRKAGISVHTASIRKPSDLDVMTPDEQREADKTLMVLSRSPLAILKAHLHCLKKNFPGYLKMTASALKLFTTGPKSPIKAFAYLAEAGILLEWAHHNNITHIHEHFANPTALVTRLMKHYGGVSYSLSIHGPDIFYTVDSAMLPEKIRDASFIRCISHYCRSQIMRISAPSEWSRYHIVRCGVDPALYSPRPEPSNEITQLLCVGRLVPAKGQHILLEACTRLKAKGYTFHLTMVGDGPDRTSLENSTAESGLDGTVTFTGALGQDKVRTYYDKADIFILASFAEGVPVVLMEAMAKEIPVIATRITGIPELIDHGKDGQLAVPGDSHNLAEEIEKLLENPPLRRKLAEAGRRKVLEQYNQHSNNTGMVKLFQEENQRT